MQIEEKTVVALRYVMKNDRGEVLEDILNGSPVRYLHGSGNILPQLEAKLAGLEAGSRKSLSFREPGSTTSVGETFYFDVVIDEVRTATEEELQMGKPVLISDCGPDCCC